MATETRHKHEKAGGAPEIVRRQSNHPGARRWQSQQSTAGPFSLMRQMQDEVDRWFGRIGLDRGWTSPSTWLSRAGEQMGDWMPAIDAFQRGNEFVIRADVPGMTRTDLSVEIGDGGDHPRRAEARTERGSRRRVLERAQLRQFLARRAAAARDDFGSGESDVHERGAGSRGASPSQDARRGPEDRYFGTRRTDAEGETLGR